jgi:hypothetical protein
MTKVREKASQKLGHEKRYSDEVKSRVGTFVNQINSKKAPGGISAAATKFRVSPLSISNWVEGEKGNGSGASGKEGVRTRSCPSSRLSTRPGPSGAGNWIFSKPASKS